MPLFLHAIKSSLYTISLTSLLYLKLYQKANLSESLCEYFQTIGLYLNGQPFGLEGYDFAIRMDRHWLLG